LIPPTSFISPLLFSIYISSKMMQLDAAISRERERGDKVIAVAPVAIYK
jgi:hypothetical protein